MHLDILHRGELHVHGESVIVGQGDRIRNNVLLTVRVGVIAGVDPVPPILPPGTLRYKTVLPGLVDPHVHLAFEAGGPLAVEPGGWDLEVSLGRALETLERLLQCGVTTVRDLGAPDGFLERLRKEISADPSRYPCVLGSGPPITAPGGHLSSFGFEVRSVSEAKDAVARCAAGGADVVKVIATGGRLTRDTPMGRLTLAPPLLHAAVDEAHHRGLPVAAHVHGTEGIVEAVRGGVDTLEHCSWTDAVGRVRLPLLRILDEMKSRGQVVVTCGPLPSRFLRLLDGLPDGGSTGGGVRHTERQLALWRNAHLAHRRGVTVAVGTDSMFGNLPHCCDLAARAVLMCAKEAGWMPMEVLQAMTGASAMATGQAPRRGVIEVGSVADLVAVGDDPLSRPECLMRPTLVIHQGAIVRRLDADRIPA